MVANEKQNTETQTTQLKTSRLTREDVDAILSQLGPHEKLSVYELREKYKDDKGPTLTEILIQMREEGR